MKIKTMKEIEQRRACLKIGERVRIKMYETIKARKKEQRNFEKFICSERKNKSKRQNVEN